MFVLENDGTLRHHCSGKVVCPQPSGGYVPLKKGCPNDQGKFERLAVSMVNFCKKESPTICSIQDENISGKKKVSMKILRSSRMLRNSRHAAILSHFSCPSPVMKPTCDLV